MSAAAKAPAPKLGEVWITYPGSVDVDHSESTKTAALTLWGDGNLVCKSDTQTWCAHLEYIMHAGTDGDTLPWKIQPDDAWIFNFPVFPTLNVFVVLLMNQIEYAIEVSYLNPHVNRSSDVSIGYLNPGEGMAAIRDMLIQNFEVAKANNPEKRLSCENSGHSFSAQIAYERNMTTPRFVLREEYCIWATGNCSTCQSSQTDWAWNDFIPEPETRSRRPF